MDTIGRYQIVQELGRGAMGAVYKALDPQIDRTVAIKVILTANLSPQDLENYKQRFFREARAAGKMSHGGIVTIYDMAEDAAGQPYLVMEYVEGRTLDGVMVEAAASGKPMPLARALAIGRQVADALDYAHRRGVVHRDVKPANILLTEDGAAKIADFGIAKMEGVQLTQTGHMLGTPAFMSPEQFSGGTIDARSDLFSLGSILYWMLTGERPFYADTLSMVTYKVVFAEPPPPTQVNATLAPAVNHVLARCLAKKPEARYAGCKELADDLAALAVGKPVQAQPLSEAEKTVVAPPAVGVEASVHLEKTAAAPSIERTVAQPAASTVPTKPAAAAQPARQVAAPQARQKASPILRVAAVLLLLLAASAGAWMYWPWPQNPAQKAPANERPAATRAPAPAATPVEEKTPDTKPEQAAPVTAVPPPPEPGAQAAGEPEPSSDSAAAPGSRGKAKGRRNRTSSATTPVGPLATLHIECLHNFREGILEVASGGRTVLRTNLRGEEQGLGLVKIYNGAFNGKVQVPAGENLFEVRVRSSRSNYDESDQIGGLFQENGARTLLIDFGRGSGLRVVSRKLTLHWK